MKLFDLLAMLDPDVEPSTCKIHLAVWSGVHDPLDVYLAGKFDTWQSGQTQRNFERPHIVSLIQMSNRHRWLFAGVHDTHGWKPVDGPARVRFHYETTRRPQPDSLNGRLIVHFERTGRQSYLRAENWTEAFTVAEIRPEPLVIAEFPGYTSCLLTKRHLDIIVSQSVPSWRAALENVAGIYVIADSKTGKLYVGSAIGAGGIWSRWCAYSRNGHGGNKELRAILHQEGPDYAANFQFGVLEIAGTQADDVIARESFWKSLLLTRQPHGMNAN